MSNVYVIADNIVAPLGRTAAENFAAVRSGRSGIQQHRDPLLSPAPFYAAMMPPGQLEAYAEGYNLSEYTKFEQLLILSVQDALAQTALDITDGRTAFIVSTTKGNIALLEQQPDAPPYGQMELFGAARKVAAYFGYQAAPIVVSNACISGLLAVLIGRRLIASGQYDHAVVTGADVMTQFVLSGFQSFQAVSPEPCRPFDAERKGVTLGEGAGTVVLSKRQELAPAGAVLAGAGSVSNDANHISGPSRTGAELGMAMRNAMLHSGLTPADIGFVSAHGTATLYNDEMEAKALHLAGLEQTPVNSFKGYYGHTLGAAGLIEAIIGIRALQQQVVLPTQGFSQPGVSLPVNVSRTLEQRSMRHYLKTVSGFGGCNAAMVFSLV
ncbi:beta-ketoacyl-[acyl-carrier-protein] synthase family protein [Chitinophaga japonensis]|uniref:3-oxoacyl-[acyl-carrier-protein] synthase-1 n=1 Tax=Chitinophaga japonensis TaxID=104662 RepID=A0A562T493_CHIJA|nr:beta-ketoacyl synthase N-terminal-like domain-containing protein [Chitinophaga japonensis]TWI88357.1 3-oxoacyl-[acyl-carrier-protein] synthase-1 [Chitinophaga japonensis]